MKGWVKRFFDGTSEIGTDRNVRLAKASWTRGRLSGMICAEVWHDRYQASISGVGDFWQSDDCEVVMYANSSRVVVRRVQKQIVPTDSWVIIDSNSFSLQVQVLSSAQKTKILAPPPGTKRKELLLSRAEAGKWLTVELRVRDGEMKLGFTEDRV